MRPFCNKCGIKPRAHNYTRNGRQYYRSMCEGCIRTKKNLPPRKPRWMTGNYKKKQSCDYCGFKSQYYSQTVVFHIDGNLENIAESNLRTICLNCSEIVKRKEINWRRGDLKIDF